MHKNVSFRSALGRKGLKMPSFFNFKKYFLSDFHITFQMKNYIRKAMNPLPISQKGSSAFIKQCCDYFLMGQENTLSGCPAVFCTGYLVMWTKISVRRSVMVSIFVYINTRISKHNTLLIHVLLTTKLGKFINFLERSKSF